MMGEETVYRPTIIFGEKVTWFIDEGKVTVVLPDGEQLVLGKNGTVSRRSSKGYGTDCCWVSTKAEALEAIQKRYARWIGEHTKHLETLRDEIMVSTIANGECHE